MFVKLNAATVSKTPAKLVMMATQRATMAVQVAPSRPGGCALADLPPVSAAAVSRLTVETASAMLEKIVTTVIPIPTTDAARNARWKQPLDGLVQEAAKQLPIRAAGVAME